MKRSDVKVHQMLADQRQSSRQKYETLVVGRRGWGSLLKYELITLFCSWVPGALGLFLRSKLYPLLFGRVGRGVIFGNNVALRHPHKIFIGDNVIIDDNCLLDAKGVTNQGITLGDGVFIGRNSILSCKDGDIRLEDGVNVGFHCEIFSSSSVVIGAGTLLAAYCYIIGGGSYDVDSRAAPFAEQDGLASSGITIGKNVWLAAGVKVLDGVTIGRDAVVGAGAVVRESIPANHIAAGVPARVRRERATAVAPPVERLQPTATGKGQP